MKIEQIVEFETQLAKVWDVIIDHNKFGQWFCCKLDQPFEEGKLSTGRMTYPGTEHIKWEAKVIRIRNEKSIEFSWPAYIDDESIDLSKESWLHGKFDLAPTTTGTLLTITESGFENLPLDIAEIAMRQNKQGWEIQARQISEYVNQFSQ